MEVLNMATRFMPIETGIHTVTSTEATATTLDITLPRDCTGVVVTILSSAGIAKPSADVTLDDDKLTIANNSTTFVLATNDVINYICF